MDKENMDENLALRFGRGNESAFEAVYRRYYPSLVLYAKKYTFNTEEAADITANSFEKLWERRQRFDSLFGIRGFLWLTTRNACFDYLKAEQAKEKALKDLAYLSPTDEKAFELQELNAEIFVQLLKNVEKLPAGCREVFRLLYYDKLTNRQVAEKLGISEATVRSQKRTAIDLLKGKFASHHMIAVLLYLSFVENSASLQVTHFH